MTTRKKPIPGRKQGRPTKYLPTHCDTVQKLCRMGHTVREICEFLNVSERTIINWRMENPAFDDAFFAGLRDPNSKVEVSLYKQAIGYFMDEEEIKVIDGQVVRVPVRKWYPPSASAAIYWTRVKMGWRDDVDPMIETKTIDADAIPESPRQVARRLAFVLHKGGKAIS